MIKRPLSDDDRLEKWAFGLIAFVVVTMCVCFLAATAGVVIVMLHVL